jgi:hypothetical protein
VFWTEDKLGNALHEILLALVAAGVLKRPEESDEQFRFRPAGQDGPRIDRKRRQACGSSPDGADGLEGTEPVRVPSL